MKAGELTSFLSGVSFTAPIHPKHLPVALSCQSYPCWILTLYALTLPFPPKSSIRTSPASVLGKMDRKTGVLWTSLGLVQEMYDTNVLPGILKAVTLVGAAVQLSNRPAPLPSLLVPRLRDVSLLQRS